MAVATTPKRQKPLPPPVVADQPPLPTKTQVTLAIEQLDLDVARLDFELAKLSTKARRETKQLAAAKIALEEQAAAKEAAAANPEAPQTQTPDLLPNPATATAVPTDKSILPPLSSLPETGPLGSLALVKEVLEGNREAAEASHESILSALPPAIRSAINAEKPQLGLVSSITPLYTCVSELACVDDNVIRHAVVGPSVKAKLAKALARRHATRLEAADNYGKLEKQYVKKTALLARMSGNSTRRRTTSRTQFTPTVGAASNPGTPISARDSARSDAEFEAILARLELEALSTVDGKPVSIHAELPDMVRFRLDKRSPLETPVWINNNGRVLDIAAQDRLSLHANPWTKEEIRTYIEKFLMHPKQFDIIASFLERKTRGECVAFYFRAGHVIQLKRLLDKSQRSLPQLFSAKDIEDQINLMESSHKLIEDGGRRGTGAYSFTNAPAPS